MTFWLGVQSMFTTESPANAGRGTMFIYAYVTALGCMCTVWRDTHVWYVTWLCDGISECNRMGMQGIGDGSRVRRKTRQRDHDNLILLRYTEHTQFIIRTIMSMVARRVAQIKLQFIFKILNFNLIISN